MELIIIAIGAAVTGALIGWHAHAAIASRILKEMLEVFGIGEKEMLEALARIKKKQDDNVCHIRVEHHKELIFAYRLDDNAFLAQADTAEELVSKIIARVGKGVYINCSLENGGDIFREQAENYQKNLH